MSGLDIQPDTQPDVQPRCPTWMSGWMSGKVVRADQLGAESHKNAQAINRTLPHYFFGHFSNATKNTLKRIVKIL